MHLIFWLFKAEDPVYSKLVRSYPQRQFIACLLEQTAYSIFWATNLCVSPTLYPSRISVVIFPLSGQLHLCLTEAVNKCYLVCLSVYIYVIYMNYFKKKSVMLYTYYKLQTKNLYTWRKSDEYSECKFHRAPCLQSMSAQNSGIPLKSIVCLKSETL